MSSLLQLEGLAFSYKGREPLFSNVNLEVEAGEVVALVGLSGSGKSTLCHCLAGIIPHVLPGKLSGRVVVEGKSTRDYTLPELAQQIGMVFQEPDTQLFMPTVEDELAFGPENLCLPREEIGRRIDNCLELVGLSQKRQHHPYRLSGGEKQRVALAAVLTLDPKILVLDEVLSPLDEQAKLAVRCIIKQLAKQGKAIIMVEHDLENLDLADRVYVLRRTQLEPFTGEL